MFEGELITPRIRLLQVLGPEGKAQVWLAEHSGLGKKVVVKLMGRTLSRNSSPLHRFQREAEVAARQLRSPFFAQILEHGLTQSGMPYLAMELLQGEDLGKRVERRGPMPYKAVIRLISQLSKGLSKAHQLGLVHRNLKPANLFLVPAESPGEEDVKILDLGLSVRAGISSMGRTTSDAAHVLAPEFLSPEQVFGQKDVDYRADFWAMSVVAYFALTGRVPFQEKTIDAFASAIEEGRFPPPSTILPGAPAALDAFFAKAFQREPAARFSSAHEVAEELERALGGELGEDRTSRTSYPHLGHRASVPGPQGTGSGRRPKLVSEKEISERLSPALREEALRAPEVITVSAVAPKSKGSSALLIAVLAIVGLGAILAGVASLSMNSSPTQSPTHPTQAPTTAPPGASR